MTVAQALATGAFDTMLRGNAMRKADRIMAAKMLRQLTNSDLATVVAAMRDYMDSKGMPHGFSHH